MRRPITPTAHGVIDYVNVALQLTIPSALGLNRGARRTTALTAVLEGLTNGVTDTRVGVLPLISLRTHGLLAAASTLPLSYFALSRGAFGGARERRFFAVLGVYFALVNGLTDWSG